MNQDEYKPLTRVELMIWAVMLIPGIAFYGALSGYFLGWFAK